MKIMTQVHFQNTLDVLKMARLKYIDLKRLGLEVIMEILDLRIPKNVFRILLKIKKMCKLIARVAVKYEKWNHRIRLVLGEWKWHNFRCDMINTHGLLYDIDVLEYFVVVMEFKLYDRYKIVYLGDVIVFDLSIAFGISSFSSSKRWLLSKYESDRSFENKHIIVYYFKGSQSKSFFHHIEFEKTQYSFCSILIIKKCAN